MPLVALFTWLMLTLPAVQERARPTLPQADRIRIAEAFRLADALGDELWPGWGRTPFAILLITAEYEFLIRHPKPPDDFTLIGEDSVLRSKIWVRKRKYDLNLLATFPISGVPTIVVGQAENTSARTSTRWVIALLHEHFHQLQYSQPEYYTEVNALGLARGDQTGSWMLNYSFPYARVDVTRGFSVLCRLIEQALSAQTQRDFAQALRAYLEAKERFRSLLDPDDYTYFSFQAWQEGIARWTEYRMAELAAAQYQPSRAFRQLGDYVPFEWEARAIKNDLEKELLSVQLNQAKRVAFYVLGAAEGLVCDRLDPTWRKRYFKEKFSLDGCFHRRSSTTQ